MKQQPRRAVRVRVQGTPGEDAGAPKTGSLLKSGDVLFIAWWKGDPSRFVRLFRATWGALPCRARRRILRHWRERKVAIVELAGDWSGYTIGVYGNTAAFGALVRFHGSTFAHMSDIGCQYVIAHELAHVLQSAEGRSYRTRREEERDARARGLAWLGLSREPLTTEAERDYLIGRSMVARATIG